MWLEPASAIVRGRNNFNFFITFAHSFVICVCVCVSVVPICIGASGQHKDSARYAVVRRFVSPNRQPLNLAYLRTLQGNSPVRLEPEPKASKFNRSSVAEWRFVVPHTHHAAQFHSLMNHLLTLNKLSPLFIYSPVINPPEVIITLTKRHVHREGKEKGETEERRKQLDRNPVPKAKEMFFKRVWGCAFGPDRRAVRMPLQLANEPNVTSCR